MSKDKILIVRNGVAHSEELPEPMDWPHSVGIGSFVDQPYENTTTNGMRAGDEGQPSQAEEAAQFGDYDFVAEPHGSFPLTHRQPKRVGDSNA